MELTGFDLETTGLDTSSDRIVQFAFINEGRRSIKLVDPGIPIPAEATAIHGISDRTVKGHPAFSHWAATIQAWVSEPEVVLVGFNSRRFDTLILDAELRRHGQAGIRLEVIQEIDVLRVWHELEPRTLEGAVQRYLGRPPDPNRAHEADWDADAALRVLQSMMDYHRFNLTEAIKLSKPEDEVDRFGRLRRDEDGDLIFNFGKHLGERCCEHVDYLTWMSEKGFPDTVLEIIRDDAREKGWA